jgi:hypothetical protein
MNAVGEPTANPFPVRQPQRRRSTRLELADILRKIRHLIGQAYTNHEIISILQLSEPTFYRYMAKIHAQDRELHKQQDREAMEFETHNLKDKLIRAERWWNKMADNESLRPADRMRAKMQAIEVAKVMVKVSNEAVAGTNHRRREAALAAKGAASAEGTVVWPSPDYDSLKRMLANSNRSSLEEEDEEQQEQQQSSPSVSQQQAVGKDDSTNDNNGE